MGLFTGLFFVAADGTLPVEIPNSAMLSGGGECVNCSQGGTSGQEMAQPVAPNQMPLNDNIFSLIQQPQQNTNFSPWNVRRGINADPMSDFYTNLPVMSGNAQIQSSHAQIMAAYQATLPSPFPSWYNPSPLSLPQAAPANAYVGQMQSAHVNAINSFYSSMAPAYSFLTPAPVFAPQPMMFY